MAYLSPAGKTGLTSEGPKRAEFIRGVAAALAAILRIAGSGEQAVRLYVIASCQELEMTRDDFVAADVPDGDLEELSPVLKGLTGQGDHR
jgi:hypothetical protein